VRVEVPVLPDDSVTVAGFRDAVGPEGETVEERLTVPVNPPVLVSEMVAVLGQKLAVERAQRPEGSGNLQAWAREVRYAAAARVAERACPGSCLPPSPQS